MLNLKVIVPSLTPLARTLFSPAHRNGLSETAMDSIGVLVAIAAIIAVAVITFIFSSVSKPSNSSKIESDAATSGDGTKKPATHQKGKAGMRGKHTPHSDKV